jgi:type I restriction enzyme S subunit
MKDRNENRPGYKETKVGWIPEDWGISHLGELARVQASNVDKKSRSDDIPVRLCNYTDVYYNETITERDGYMEATAKQSEIDKFLLKKGDVIITKDSETPDDIAIPTYVAQNFNDLVCGYHLSLIRPKKTRLDGAYLNKLFQLQFYRHYFFTLANGVTRYGLTMESTVKALIPEPLIDEQ